MSYAIIKNVSIKNKKVYITSASNNVYPKIYRRGHCPSLTRILEEKGRDELDSIILAEFRKGNFQGLSTPYGKALIWQSQIGDKFSAKNDAELFRAFKTAWSEKTPVTAYYQDKPILSVGRSNFKYSHDLAEGKIFKNIAQARYALRNFSLSEIRFNAPLLKVAA